MQITGTYGATTITKDDVRAGETVGEFTTRVKIVLGLPQNVVARIDGRVVTNDSTLRNGEEIVYEAQAASKA